MDRDFIIYDNLATADKALKLMDPLFLEAPRREQDKKTFKLVRWMGEQEGRDYEFNAFVKWKHQVDPLDNKRVVIFNLVQPVTRFKRDLGLQVVSDRTRCLDGVDLTVDPKRPGRGLSSVLKTWLLRQRYLR